MKFLENTLTEEVKALASELGADLVGIASADRWEFAPIQHSPRGIMPTAQSAIVCGVHFLDANTERGGEPDIRYPGPALTEMSASETLFYMAWKLAKFLQDRGYRAIAIPQSGLWNYRPTEGAPRGMIADLTHYYAAVAAGLGEIGWNNLCLTPEFGPRQRLVTVITDAQLRQDPLYRGEPLCDKCMLCRKNCPTQAFEKDVSGKLLNIRIEDRVFEFPDRNLWRCGIGENFQLDVYLPWEERVDEELIKKMTYKAVTEKPEWYYGWKMGACLKYCVPKARRYFDRSYSKSPRRRRDIVPVETEENTQVMLEKLKGKTTELGFDFMGIAGAGELAKAGIDITAHMPDGKSVLVVGFGYPEGCYLNTDFFVHYGELWLGRLIQREGFSAMTRSDLPPGISALCCGLAEKDDGDTLRTPEFSGNVLWRTVITSMPYEGSSGNLLPRELISKEKAENLPEKITAIAKGEGIELVGFASREKMDDIADQLEPIFAENRDYFLVKNKGWNMTADFGVDKGKNIWAVQALPFNPEIIENAVPRPKRVEDYLPEGKSLIVFGLHLLEASADWAGKGEGKKAAHFMYSTHVESFNQLSVGMMKVAKYLNSQGYRAIPAFDFEGLASAVYGMGEPPDLTASRFAALAAGMGELGLNGQVLTKEFGLRQRFAVLVTDAKLPSGSVYQGEPLCTKCGRCVEACPMNALSTEIRQTITIDGRDFSIPSLERERCDCCQRYGLVPDSGVKYIGNTNDFAIPEKVTPEFVCQACRDSDRMQQPGYATIVQRCYTECPAGH